ncbi:MAG: hypothetical protein OHK0022_29950 [Roseiflexaceae bacterium]
MFVRIMALLSIISMLHPPTPAFAAPLGQTVSISPTVECVIRQSDGSLIGIFGYNNSSTSLASVPIGSSNTFSPTPDNRGQPTVFNPGREVAVFRVPFSGTLIWQLTGRNATASSASSTCSLSRSDTQPPTTPQNLRITGRTTTSVSIAWNASTDNFSNLRYEVYGDGALIGITSATSFVYNGSTSSNGPVVTIVTRDAGTNRSAPSAPLNLGDQPPTLGPGSLQVAEDTPGTLDLALLASDPEARPLVFGIATAPAHGQATLLGATLTYTPTANFNGSDNVRVRATDAAGQTAEANVSIQVTPVNDPPQASLSATPISGTIPLAVNFSASASDIDGDTLSYAWDFGDGTTGSGASTSHTYTSPGSFVARLTVEDSNGGRAVQQTSIVAIGSNNNQAPVARNGGVTWDASGQASLDLATLTSDPDADPLQYSLLAQPSVGTAALQGSLVTISLSAAYTGTVTVDYQVSDGRGGSARATLRASRRDLLPEGSVVVGVNGVALGAAPQAVTLAVTPTITVAPTLTAALPSAYLPIGQPYTLTVASDQPLQSTGGDFLLGLPVPSGVPTDSLALAVYLPRFGDQAAQWELNYGQYSPSSGLFVADLPFINRTGIQVTLVANRTFAPIQPLLYTEQSNESYRSAGLMSLANAPLAAVDLRRIAIVTDDPNAANPTTTPLSLRQAYYNGVKELVKRFRVYGFDNPAIRQIRASLLNSTSVKPLLLFPQQVTPKNPQELYTVFYVELQGVNNCQTDVVNGVIRGYYNVLSRNLVYCYTPGQTTFSQSDLETLAHEFTHSLQGPLVLPKADIQTIGFYDEGTAEILGATIAFQRPARNPNQSPRSVALPLSSGPDAPSDQTVFGWYEAQDLWFYWLKTYAGSNPGALKQVFSDIYANPTLAGVNQALTASGVSLPDLYWEWVRKHAFEDPNYLEIPGLTETCSQKPFSNTSDDDIDGAEMDEINQDGDVIDTSPGIDYDYNPAAAPTQSRPSSQRVFEFNLPIEPLTSDGTLITIRSTANAKFRVRVTSENDAQLRAALYRIGEGSCNGGDGTNYERTVEVNAGNDVQLWLQAANILVASDDGTSDLDNVRVVITPITPTPVNDNYSSPSSNTDPAGTVTVDVGTTSPELRVLSNDGPIDRRDDMRVAEVRATIGSAVISSDGRSITYTAPNGPEWETCVPNNEVPVTFTYRSKFANEQELSPQSATVTVKVRLRQRPSDNCLIARPDFASGTPGQVITIPVLINDEFSGIAAPVVAITTPPSQGSASVTGASGLQRVRYTVPDIPTCRPEPRTDQFSYLFTDPLNPTRTSNVTVVVVDYTTRADPQLCPKDPAPLPDLPTEPAPKKRSLVKPPELVPSSSTTPGWLPWAIVGALVVVAAIVVGCTLAPVTCLAIAAGVATVVATVALTPRQVAAADGDPHITSFDGVSYSPQTLGEFVYAQPVVSPTLTLQARHERINGFADWASFVTAAAVQAGGHTFEVRLPASGRLGDEAVLLIDGTVVDLAPGMYTFGGAVLKVAAGNDATIYTADGGISGSTQADLISWVRISMFADSRLVRSGSTEQAAGLRLEVSVPSNGNARGLLGTPDGNANNEFQLPDGAFATTFNAFNEAWRITDRTKSLFTYAPGTGPETYNKIQDRAPPSQADLEGRTGGTNYMQRARDLLAMTCQVDTSALEPTFIRDIAMELAAGRTADNLIASGLCKDNSVASVGQPAIPLVGYQFSGQVTMQGRPEIGLPGAKVVISSPTLGQVLCETTTGEAGRYGCSLSTYALSGTTTLELRYRVTGRGAPIDQAVSLPMPQPGELLVQQRDFAAKIDTVLLLTGTVRDPAGLPAASAPIQISGPGFVQATASPTGTLQVYYPLPNGVTRGTLVVEAADRTFSTYVRKDVPFELTQTGVVPLSLDLQTIAQPVPQLVNPTPSTPDLRRYLVVAGTITNTLLSSLAPVGGVQVTVSGPPGSDINCSTTSSSNGGYQCSSQISNTVTLTTPVTVEFSGAGTTVRQIILTPDELPVVDSGGVLVKTVDTGLPATVLRLTGRVVGAGSGLAGATIQVRNPATGASASATTQPDGSYLIELPLMDAAIGNGNQVDLVYQSTYSTVSGSSTTTVPATVNGVVRNGVSNFNRDLEFTARTVAFTGRIRNALVTGSPGVPGALVRISSPTKGTVCEVTTDTNGFYGCDLSIQDTVPFEVSYQISRRGSLTSSTFTVDPTGLGINGRLPFAQSFTVSPITLQVQGVVRDPNNRTQADVQVGLYGLGGASAQARTASDGSYTAYVVVDNGSSSGSIALSAYQQGDLVTLRASGQLNVTGPLAGLVPLAAPALVLDGAFLDPAQAGKIRLYGTVRNQTEPQASMNGLTLVISSARYGELCRTVTGNNGSYNCPERVLPETGSLALSYEVVGFAAAQSTTVTVQPGVLTNDIRYEVNIRPASVLVQGSVRTLNNQPAVSAQISVSGAAQGSTITDSQGDYALYLPLPSGELQGTITTTVQADGDTQALVQQLNAQPSALTILPALNVLARVPRVSAPASLSLIASAGAVQTTTLTLQNTGNYTLSANLSVYNPLSTPWLSIAPTTTLTIAPGASASGTVRLSATALVSGTYQANIQVQSNDRNQPSLLIPVTARVTGTPAVTLNPSTITFGDQFIGATITQTLTVRNTGTADLQISGASSNQPGFRAAPAASTVAPGEQTTLAVAWTPSATGPITGVVTLNTNAGAPAISVSGRGLLPPGTSISPQAIIATLNAGQILTRTLTINNTGSNPLEWTIQGAGNGLKVAVLGAENTYLDGVAQSLRSSGTFRSVAAINAATTTPTLAELQQYNAVLVFSNTGFADAALLGDRLADYADGGGGVVTMHFTIGSVLLSGRFASDGYRALLPGNNSNSGNVQLGTLDQPNHPLFRGVTSFNPGSSGFYSNSAAAPGAQVLGRYSNNIPLAAEQTLQRGGRIIRRLDLNFFPPSSQQRSDFWDASTDGLRLMTNALAYVGGATYLRTSPSQGTIATGASQAVAVGLDATNLISGTYRADLLVGSNDPLRPQTTIPVTLTVLGTPVLASTPSNLDFGTVFVGQQLTRTLTLSNTGTADAILTLTSSLADVRPLSPTLRLIPQQVVRVPVVFAPTAVATLSGTLSLTGNLPTISVPLAGRGLIAPVVQVAPSQIVAALNSGQQLTRTLVISNTGNSDLTWNLSTQDGRLSEVRNTLNNGYTAVTSIIPDRYDFTDGEIGSSISDGGGDMYDNGNILNTNLATTIPYTNTGIANNAAFGNGGAYFTRKYPGLFVLAADLRDVDWFEITGNVGADGSGNTDTIVLETTIASVTYQGFVKRIYDAGDPSVNHLIIVEKRPGISQTFATNTDNDQHRVSGLRGTTRLYYLLYARESGGYIDNTATLAIMRAFLTTLNESGGLSVNWLGVSANSGTTPLDTASSIAVGLNATNLISGTYRANLRLSSNDPLRPQATVPVTLTVLGTPQATLSPATLDFGALFVGLTLTHTLTITNSGSANLNITSLSSSQADVQVVGGTTARTLAPDQAVSLPVVFRPTAAGNRNGTLTLNGNAAGTVSFSAAGVLPPVLALNPAAVNVTVSAGSVVTPTVVVGNSGSSPLIWSLTTPNGTLEQIRSDLDAGASSVTTLIPNRYDFSDGETGTSIDDGGNDMYDGGNLLNTDLGSQIPYQDTTIGSSAAFGGGRYFTRKYPGLFVLAAELNGVGRFGTSGNLGADGSGSTSTVTLTLTVDGIRYLGFAKRVYNAGDPSVNQLIIVEERPGISQSFTTDTDNGFQEVRGLGGNTRLYYLLYASAGGGFVNDAQTQAIMQQFLQTIRPYNWLKVQPGSGTTAPSATTPVGVVLDARQLGVGTYTSRIDVASNDPLQPNMTVPVTLTVTSP